MTYSELKYIDAINALGRAKQIEIAERLEVSKVSVFKAMAKLVDKRYVEKNADKYSLTSLGRTLYEEYMALSKYILNELLERCDINQNKAKNDSLKIACVMSGEIRKIILSNLNKDILL